MTNAGLRLINRQHNAWYIRKSGPFDWNRSCYKHYSSDQGCANQEYFQHSRSPQQGYAPDFKSQRTNRNFDLNQLCFGFPIHAHMLRHACGFKLANDGHDTRAIQAYLGHRSIMSTVRYTALTPNRFKNFWKD
jgi:integrase